jgi:hypothetical protein
MQMYICAWVYDVHLTGHCFQGLRTAAQHGPYSRGCIVSENCLVAQQVLQNINQAPLPPRPQLLVHPHLVRLGSLRCGSLMGTVQGIADSNCSSGTAERKDLRRGRHSAADWLLGPRCRARRGLHASQAGLLFPT